MAGFENFEDFRRRRRESELKEYREYVPEELADIVAADRNEKKRGKRRSPRKTEQRGTPWYKNRNYYYLVLVLLVVILLCLYFLPISFGQVEVEGNRFLHKDEILRVAKVERPVNILRLSTSDMERRLSGDLRILSVDVKREFPAEIYIYVEERVPLAMIKCEFGFAVLDKTGTVIGMGAIIKDVGVPFISGKKMGNVLLGDRLEDIAIIPALNYLSNLSGDGWKQISEINIGNPDQITVYTKDDIPIRLGHAEQAEEQAPLSENMLRDIRVRNLDVLYVDANVGAPYIKLK